MLSEAAGWRQLKSETLLPGGDKAWPLVVLWSYHTGYPCSLVHLLELVIIAQKTGCPSVTNTNCKKAFKANMLSSSRNKSNGTHISSLHYVLLGQFHTVVISLTTTFHFLHMEAAWYGERVTAADKTVCKECHTEACAEGSGFLREMSKNKFGVNLEYKIHTFCCISWKLLLRRWTYTGLLTYVHCLLWAR